MIYLVYFCTGDYFVIIREEYNISILHCIYILRLSLSVKSVWAQVQNNKMYHFFTKGIQGKGKSIGGLGNQLEV